MNFFGKKYIKNLFLAAMTLFIAMDIHTGQQPGGLAAARAKAQEAQKSAKAAQTTTPSVAGKAAAPKKSLASKAPVAKRALSKDVLDRIEEEKQRIRGGAAPTPAEPAETTTEPKVKTAELGTITPAVAPPVAAEEEEEGEEDTYVQTEAHLQLDEVRKLMKQFPLYAEGTIHKEGEVIVKKTPNEIV